MTPRARAGSLLLAAVLVAAVVLVLSSRAHRPAGSRPAPSAGPPVGARYVGRTACLPCHEKEDALWRGSHHDLAMAKPDEPTVKGDFSGATFTYGAVTSTFTRRDGRYFVRTDGPDGALHDYEIAYTFGIYPLQQYLIAFPGGRYQALNVCWDARPRAEGGQRWFHLYPNERVSHDHPFHWTGPYQNWNFMCAECHSTNVVKGYRPQEDRYETTWSEIDVSCEACHGPGSAHVAWGEAVRKGRARAADPANGLVALADAGGPARWEIDMARGIAARTPPRTSNLEVETCALCHARRSVIAEPHVPGRPLLDTHRPALLEENLYFPDGQIQDEVYEYGSFLQSRMYRAGVACSDCHDPHRLKVRVSADLTCARCHLRERFDTPAHHFHKPASPGASCVACHMPSRLYMVVDKRLDHGFRVPRPDLTVKLGAPNACAPCHRDRSTAWLREAAARWWPRLEARPQYGFALLAGRTAQADAEGRLAVLAEDAASPAIARATAVALLGGFLGPDAVPTVERALRDPDPLLRMAAVAAAGGLPEAERAHLLPPLLSDPVRTVRVDAARALASSSAGLPPPAREAFARAFAEWEDVQDLNADRAESHLNLGALFVERGELDRARAEYETALRLNRWLPATYVNLADLARQRGDEPEAVRVLQAGLAVAPDSADLHYGLGLALVRQGRAPEAAASLERATVLAPGQPHFAYAYALALHSAGRTGRALDVLRAAHAAHPGDQEVLLALATMSRDAGRLKDALDYARRLVTLAPGAPAARALVADIEERSRRTTPAR